VVCLRALHNKEIRVYNPQSQEFSCDMYVVCTEKREIRYTHRILLKILLESDILKTQVIDNITMDIWEIFCEILNCIKLFHFHVRWKISY